MRCSICYGEIEVVRHGDHVWSEGHNAQPVNDGRCCGSCNDNVVIPARLRIIFGRKAEAAAKGGEK